jgi:hypothetical protein
MVFIKGLAAGLLAFAAAFTALIGFGVLLEADGELAVIPAPAITFLLAVMASRGLWQLGVVAGLTISCVALTFLVGPWGLALFVLPMVAAWGLGRIVARRRGSNAPPIDDASEAFGWPPGAGPRTTTDRDPRAVIAGLGAVAIAAVIAWQLAGLPGMPRAQTTEPAGGGPATVETIGSLPSLSEVTVGQCFSDLLASNDPPMVLGEQVVPCAQPHQDEMIGTATYPAAPGAAFPPGTALDDYADQFCRNALQEYVGIPAGSSMLGWAYTTPNQESWSSDGDRWIGCWVESTPPAAPLVGSVRGTKQ